MQPAPTFGRRSAPVAASRPRAPAPFSAPPDHAAFFNAARAEAMDKPRERAVPRSFRAAMLAGLVVGCCLAGLDVTRASESLHALSGGLLPDRAVSRLVPVVIMLGLLGGARAAATSLLLAHAVLRRCAFTSHLAYTVGGAAVAAAFSFVTLAAVQSGLLGTETMPTHGLALDIAAGAGAGFFYRVFAGAVPAA